MTMVQVRNFLLRRGFRVHHTGSSAMTYMFPPGWKYILRLVDVQLNNMLEKELGELKESHVMNDELSWFSKVLKSAWHDAFLQTLCFTPHDHEQNM